MTKLHQVVEITAPPETVWRVVSDPTYLPKLLHGVLTSEANPPGRAVVGMRVTMTGNVADMTMSTDVQVTRVEKERCLEARGMDGGIFSPFLQQVTLKQKGWDTEVSVDFEYSLIPGLDRLVGDVHVLQEALDMAFKGYAKNLKEIAELIPMPE